MGTNYLNDVCHPVYHVQYIVRYTVRYTVRPGMCGREVICKIDSKLLLCLAAVSLLSGGWKRSLWKASVCHGLISGPGQNGLT